MDGWFGHGEWQFYLDFGSQGCHYLREFLLDDEVDLVGIANPMALRIRYVRDTFPGIICSSSTCNLW